MWEKKEKAIVKRRKRKRKQNKTSLIGFIFLFLIGAGILFYPTISDWFAQRNNTVARQSYEQNVSNLTKEEKEELWRAAIYYNERLANSVVKDPFANTENIEPFDEYYQTLDVGDEAMGYIHIPKIRVLLPIYHGVSEEVLEKGVGHIPASALPVGGEGTHCVLTGHTGLRQAKMFNELTELREGDEFYLEILNETLAYQIRKIEVVLPDDVSSLRIEAGKDKATLITCTPYSVNSHRLLVTGERVPYTEDMRRSRDNTKTAFPYWIVIVIFTVGIVVMFAGQRIREKRRKAANNKISSEVNRRGKHEKKAK